MDNWQIFSKKLFQHFIHHKKTLKVRKFQFKIICRSRVLDKNLPLWYILPPPLPLVEVLLFLLGILTLVFHFSLILVNIFFLLYDIVF